VKTKKKMRQPRCGLLDIQMLSSGGGSAFKWPKSEVTYAIVTDTHQMPHSTVREAIRKAYGTWSAVVPLTFREVSSGENADIKVKFGSGNHGDPWPFDGPGGVLAHATMPTSGMLHFDDDERWTFMDAAKISRHFTDLLPVAIHEGGHTLGLEHSRNPKAIMAPFYQETVDSSGNYITPKLTSDDIQAIQQIYGSGRGRSASVGGGMESLFGLKKAYSA
jgi:matrix metalloproteinase-13 (collagenase 3)